MAEINAFNPAEIAKLEVEAVLDCLDFDILILSRDLKITFANKSFLNRIGMKPGDVISQFCYKITHHSDTQCKPPNDPCPVEKVIKTGQPAIEAHTHLSKDNKKILVNVTAALLKNEEKEIGFIHIALPVKTGIDKDEEMKSALNKTMDVLNVVNLYQSQMKEIQEKTEMLEQTKKDLELKVNELEKFNRLAINRELEMIKLKQKVKEVEGQQLK
jgi:hypothetical protein